MSLVFLHWVGVMGGMGNTYHLHGLRVLAWNS